jgi:hypothetical protein
MSVEPSPFFPSSHSLTVRSKRLARPLRIVDGTIKSCHDGFVGGTRI